MPAVEPSVQMPSSKRWTVISAIAGAAVLLVVGIAAFLLTYKILPPPDNALIITDDERATYASTPCVLFNHLDRELIGNRSEISDPSKPLQLLSYTSERKIADITSDAKWKRDKACNFSAGFDQIVTTWMRLTGYRSRWAEDGQWRW